MIFIYWLDKYNYYLIMTDNFCIRQRGEGGSDMLVIAIPADSHPDWEYFDYLDEIGQRARFDADFCWSLRELMPQQAVWDLIECCKELDTLSWT